MKSKRAEDQITWYIDHRIEFLENQQKKLRHVLDPELPVDFETLGEFLELKGRVKELRNLRQRLDDL